MIPLDIPCSERYNYYIPIISACQDDNGQVKELTLNNTMIPLDIPCSERYNYYIHIISTCQDDNGWVK